MKYLWNTTIKNQNLLIRITYAINYLVYLEETMGEWGNKVEGWSSYRIRLIQYLLNK